MSGGVSGGAAARPQVFSSACGGTRIFSFNLPGQAVILFGSIREACLSGEKSHLHRLLKILNLVQSGPGWNARRLSEHFGVDRRTIHRNIKSLVDAGFALDHDPEADGYRLRGGQAFLRPLDFTLDEAVALSILPADDQIPFTRHALEAIAKVRCMLPKRFSRSLEALGGRVGVHLARSEDGKAVETVYGKVRDAISQRKALCCTYQSQRSQREDDGSESELFDFEPYGLYFVKRAWYAIGRHDGHDEIRWLRLSRFGSIRRTHRRYAIPKNFSLDKQMGQAWRMMRGAKRYAVALRFDAEFADGIESTQWHATQTIETLPDGGLIFRCEVDGLDEIVWWILGYGPHAAVIEPRELADRVRDLAAATAHQYENSAAEPRGKRRPAQAIDKKTNRQTPSSP